MKTLTTVTLVCLLALGGLFLSGCGTKDYLSLRHAQEAADSVNQLLPDSKLPESAKKAIKEQAEEWVKYEQGK